MNPLEKRIFEADTLSVRERVAAVVRLEEPDRVPVSLMLYYFAPLYAGVSMSRYMTDTGVYRAVMRRVWEDFGPWDLYYNINPVSRLVYSYVNMMRILWPGRELPEDQMAVVEEIEYLRPEDYDEALRLPAAAADPLFRLRALPRFCREAEGLGAARTAARCIRDVARQVVFWKRDFAWWRAQGAAVQIGYQAEMPFDVFSQGRNVVNFSMDLFRMPRKIGEASRHLARSWAATAVWIARIVGVPTVQCYCHRTSNSFISPEQFQRLALPSMEIVLHRLVEAGITPILHCDGDWLRNLPAMRRRLPARKIVLQLDGLTDIFRAKQEIGDHMCLFGDVPAARLAEGSPAEVEEYCHKLIEEAGRGGGFILAAGCEIPPNARPENIRAMLTAARKYGSYTRTERAPEAAA